MKEMIPSSPCGGGGDLLPELPVQSSLLHTNSSKSQEKYEDALTLNGIVEIDQDCVGGSL
eukprot:CAMPEP_0195538042 /NCGR_PEP_ID=MMETSP0794_2-20130614/49117_1 /TAXON_ID=515487 /ORGANISM="Stephanopyxis turris, Strain CCMP 815" /LENGTH=59 /DNA_ID=CAMNT_0040671971 /DNA_START=260 /DNA_END=439 /DNA_ORIENTATION=+